MTFNGLEELHPLQVKNLPLSPTLALLRAYSPLARCNDQGRETMKATIESAVAVPTQVSADPLRDYEGCSDARLVECARNGDRDAFGELVLRYEGRLMRVISRFILDQQIVEDIAQDVFLRVFRRLELFDPSRRFGPWLFQVGVNQTLDYLRKTRRRIRWTLFSQKSDEDLRSIDPPTTDPRIHLDLAQEVRKVLDMMPEKYRSVLILRDLENFSTAEISTILNRKEATIRWRLAEARLKFQKLWSARQNERPLSDLSEVASDELYDGPPTDGIEGGE